MTKKSKVTLVILAVIILIIVGAVNYKRLLPFGTIWEISPLNSSQALFHYTENRFGKIANRVGLFDVEKNRMLWKSRLPDNMVPLLNFHADEEITALRYFTKESDTLDHQGIVAFSTKDGRELWRSKIVPYHYTKASEHNSIWSPRFVTFADKNRLYEHFSSGTDPNGQRWFYLMALNKKTGETEWTYRYESGNGLENFLQTDALVFLLNSETDQVIILDKVTGETVFSYENDRFTPLGVIGNQQYWYIRNFNLYAFDLERRTNSLIKTGIADSWIKVQNYGIHNQNLIVLYEKIPIRSYALEAFSTDNGSSQWKLELKESSAKIDYNKPLPITGVQPGALCGPLTQILPLAFTDLEKDRIMLFRINLADPAVINVEQIPHDFDHDFRLRYQNGKHYFIFERPDVRIGYIQNNFTKIIRMSNFMILNNHLSHVKDGKIWFFHSDADFFPLKNWAVLDEENLEILATGNPELFRDSYRIVPDFFD